MKFTLLPKLFTGLGVCLMTVGPLQSAADNFVFKAEISETVVADSLKIYPNPAKDRLYFKGLGEGKSLEVNIFDVLGKLVISSKVSYQSMSSGLDIGKLNRGIYLVKMDDGTQIITQKLIKE